MVSYRKSRICVYTDFGASSPLVDSVILSVASSRLPTPQILPSRHFLRNLVPSQSNPTSSAPLVWLHSAEQYFPTDLQVFLDNTKPRVNFNEVAGPSPLDLNSLNRLGGDVFLTCKDDPTTSPAWIKGTKPNAEGKTEGATTGAVIVNDKGNGNVDVFYFTFYANNWGGIVAGIKSLNFGNHVGDWEHTMIRFANGLPTHMWYSQHANGQAFRYDVTRKHNSGLRPLAFSSNGSHANYAIPGTHDHLIPNFNLPGGVLEDHTNEGFLWDPLPNSLFYRFDAPANKFTAYDGKAPLAWLDFGGRWGDQEYPTSDRRQVKVFGQAKYGSGPTGPRDKQLGRGNVCPDNGKTCILRTILVPKSVGSEDELLEGDVVQE
ncbi:hypothetical protein BDV95DRAFT_589636 [Massariosphaeria phaeospora]|uniref:Vacuolar protein sorting-associated protein 62 n=1 Tax=Massariosphaeria phaeospora TaxID=100035 RepID=A0A7C8IE02_9PLEO|nr:hypothetical protein BDV95DRAFT_589636 [Massariosphaeria phaeospora]